MTSQQVGLPFQVLCQLIVSVAPDFVCENLVTVQSPLQVQPTSLLDGYVSYDDIGVAYKIFTERVTWTEARERCNLQGASLAIVDSQKKVDFIVGLAPNGTDELQIGIYRMDDKWTGVGTGKTLSNVPWLSPPHYPRSSDGPCGRLQLIAPIGVWNWDCIKNPHSYVCEIPLP